MLRSLSWFAIVCFVSFGAADARAEPVDLTRAVVVIRAGELPAAEKIAPVILTEEIAARTGLHWKVSTEWPAQADAIIAISTSANPPAWKDRLPAKDAPSKKAEAFAIRVVPAADKRPAIVQITGADPRGAMFGVGKLLRTLDWQLGRVALDARFSTDEAPDRPLRGHQIGYRNTANSWDAWTYEQYDQYFREMVIFGTNAVENIPWEGGPRSPVMKYSREEMNLKFAELCAKYDLDHWIWVPVLVHLPDTPQEEAFLKQQEAYYKQIKRLDAVFVPGGDPGHTRPKVLFDLLEKQTANLKKFHPKAAMWMSPQSFTGPWMEEFYELIRKEPAW
ncbi:MAG TPA: hypothetical protein VL475_06580, partial [Planctomycetaceae bacterium]|nr:hypothetical protein [Planctomycetaceae bacterium]